MRKIVFRGKRVKPVTLVSQWIYGNYVFKADNSLPGLSKHFIVVHDGFGVSQWIEVEQKTVSQYTGLTDKHGRRIFEGDIVHMKGGCVSGFGAVEFRNGSFGIVDAKRKRFYLLDDHSVYRVEGNIHDNGELIHEK